MSTDERVSAERVIEGVLAHVADQARTRSIEIHTDYDTEAVLTPDDEFAARLLDLVRFAVATAPDDSSIMLAVARPAARVAPVGAAVLVLRWQVGDLPTSSTAPRGPVVPILAQAAGARELARSDRAERLARGFAELHWNFEIEVLSQDRELCVRASCPT